MMNKSIAFLVSNDLVYDQRMIRICSTLGKNGYKVSLIGRVKANSKPIVENIDFFQIRLNCWVEKGILFYFLLNLRLFLFLCKNRFDIVCANDTDTLLAATLIKFFQKNKLVFDSHEYFTEVPELINAPFKKMIWNSVEQFGVKNADLTYTVNESLASIFSKIHNKQFGVIRNVPFQKEVENINSHKEKIIIYQGAINEGRGLEELIFALKDHHSVKIWLFGEGDILPQLKEMVKANEIKNVEFFGFILPKDLPKFTNQAWLGVNLLKSESLNYYYSLANKTFDYMQAGIPTLNMDFPEYKLIHQKFQIGILLDTLAVEVIQKAVNTFLNDDNFYQKCSQACLLASQEYNWENEAKKLKQLYDNL